MSEVTFLGKKSMFRTAKYAVKEKIDLQVLRNAKEGEKKPRQCKDSSQRQVDELPTIKETIPEIKKSVQLMSNQHDTLLKNITEQGKQVKELSVRVDKLKQSQGTERIKIKKTWIT